MAKHYTCDICDKPVTLGIKDQICDLHIPLQATNVDAVIRLVVINPAESVDDICFSCMGNEMILQSQQRKEVIDWGLKHKP